MKIGLYFGSFNPVHIGHLIIANFVAQNTSHEQVWLIVSPQNPLKLSSTLLNEYHRLHLVRLAISDNIKLKASDVEFKLPRPSFTIDTLTYLEEKYPKHEFSVIIGSDSFQNIPKWKNADLLLEKYRFLIYLRPGFAVTKPVAANIEILSAPMLEISSSFIRECIKSSNSIQYLVTENVRLEIEENSYYK
jgi:nicotinate-nucleotide adenylyltransferase